jgi:hypothetical protein
MRARYSSLGQSWVNIDSPPQCLKCGSTILPEGEHPLKKEAVAELVQLVAEDNAGFKNEIRIREIGEELNREGGIELMKKAYYAVRDQGVYFSQDIWYEIGGWNS